MVALHFGVSLISILSSAVVTLGAEGTITLDDVLAEMSSLKSGIDNKMSSMRNEMSLMRNDISSKRNDMSSMRNDMSSMRNDMSSMRNDMDKLIRLEEELIDIHLSPKTTPTTTTLRPTTTNPTAPPQTTSPTLPPQTTTPTPPPLPPQASACSSYTELSDAWRHVDYVNRDNSSLHCDQTGSKSWHTNLAWGSWFRFTGAAGTKLPTAPAPVGGGPDIGGNQICGTLGVAYISSGGNPTIQDGIVTRDVCFEFRSNSCWGGKTTVGVAACRDIHGEYFVYQLQPAPGLCSFAYCAID